MCRSQSDSRLAVAAITTPALSAALSGQAAQPRVEGWPQWRGANRDGAATFTAPASWPDALNQKWKVEVGRGYSAPIIVGDRVYAFSRQDDNEVMRALDAATGKTMWESKYVATFKRKPAPEAIRSCGPPRSHW